MQLKVCPKCRSKEIEVSAPFIWFGDRVYNCRKCGFRSPLFPEDSRTTKKRVRK